jgi:hypothetical protein
MAAVYAGVEDVRSAWNRPVPESRVPYVQDKLDRAHRLLRRRAPGLDARVAGGQLAPEDVGDVIVRMVIRVLRNPEGYRTETDGDYSYGRDTRSASGELTVTDEDLEELGYGKSSTYAVSSTDTVLATAWRRDPCPPRRPELW